MKMTKYSGTLSEFGNSRDGGANAMTYDYLIVGGEIVKDIVVVSKLESKLRASLGDKIELHIVDNRLVAITEPDGRMYAFSYPLAPTLSRFFGFATVFFFFGTWAAAQSSRGGRFSDTELLAFPGGILFIVCLLCWCLFLPNSRIQKVINKELPKDAIMMNS